MRAPFTQPTFAAGELSPALRARVDLAKYQAGLALCKNHIIHAQGGVSNRPGTRYCGATKYPEKICRIIPFEFNVEQSYILEFGDQYMRVWCNGAQVLTEELAVGSSDYQWTASTTNPLEFYLEKAGGGDPGIPQPSSFNDSGTEYALGTIGALDYGEWAWGDNDSLGFSTIYIRLVDRYTQLDITGAAYQWTRSANGTREWYLEAAGGGATELGKPLVLFEGGIVRQEATINGIGELIGGSWAWGDNDSLGFSTLYYRLITETYTSDLVLASTYKWTASGSGTNEYYLEALAGGDPQVPQPDEVVEDITPFVPGSLGSLSAGEWGWGDNDSLGYSTVYVRLTDNVDPDTHADGYLSGLFAHDPDDFVQGGLQAGYAGNPADLPDAYLGAGYGTGEGFEPFELVTPYLESEVRELQYAQSADVLYLAHRNHPPAKLSRLDHAVWTLEILSYMPKQQPPTAVTGTPSAAGDIEYYYRVTAVDRHGEESLSDPTIGGAAGSAGWPIDNVYNSDPVEVHLAGAGNLLGAHSLYSGDRARVEDVGGMTAINDREFEVESSWEISYFHDRNNEKVEFIAPTAREFRYAEPISFSGVDRAFPAGSPYRDKYVYYVLSWNSVTGLTIAVTQRHETDPYYRDLGRPTVRALKRVHLVGEDGTGYETYTEGGALYPANKDAAILSDELGQGEPKASITLEWEAAPGAVSYNVYRKFNGIFGWIGRTEELTFVDDGILPDIADSLVKARNPFLLEGDWPAAVALHSQRLVYASSVNDPLGIWMSRPGYLENFTVSEPSQDDDSLTFRPASRQVNAIRHLVPLYGLATLSQGQHFLVRSDGPLTPRSLDIKPMGYRGASLVMPLTIGANVLFVEQKGSSLWVATYSEEQGGYSGTCLSILAAHLLKNREVVAMAYAQVPDSIVWVIRDDGVLLGLTYVPEHDVYAWHQHDTACGEFEDVATVSEGEEDAVYFVVNRSFGEGESARYLERLATRKTDRLTANFLDSSLIYSGVAADTMGGLGHLEGHNVSALADGRVVKNLVVSGGQVTLPFEAEYVLVGLPINALVQTLELDLGAETRARKRRITSFRAKLEESRPFLAGPRLIDLLLVKPESDAEPYTGEAALTTTPIWGDQAEMFVRPPDPLPLTVLSILPEFDVGG